MKVLGIYDSHNCGATIVEDGKILAAIEEERISRNKIEFGFPECSVRMVMELSKSSWKDIDAIAVAGVRDPFFLFRWKVGKIRFEREINLKWRIQYFIWRAIYLLRQFPLVGLFEKYFIGK